MVKSWKAGMRIALPVLATFAAITADAGVSGYDLIAIIVIPFLVGRLCSE